MKYFYIRGISSSSKIEIMQYVLVLTLLFFSGYSSAEVDIFSVFRETDGSTNWQYVANTSSGLLIIALLIALIKITFTQRKISRFNKYLIDIKEDLEKRVSERTATLKESNEKLSETNNALESEVKKHLTTARQLKKSEAYIAEVLSSMPLMLIGLDKKNRITQWNPKAEEISGISNKNAMGEYLWDAYPDITVSPEKIAEAQKKQTTVSIKYSQKGQYHFDILIYPLRESSKTGVVLLIDDITLRVNSETQLIQKDKMSLMGELASIMAHDVNIPISEMLKSIKMARSQLAQDNYEKSEIMEELDNSLIGAQQARVVIENLINFSSDGSQPKANENILQVIDQSLELASDVLSINSGVNFHDVLIEKDYSKDLPQVACYAVELKQVFLSILRNACLFMGKVDANEYIPKINISVSSFYEDIWIKIKHNGAPMNDHEQQYLFDSFESPASSIANKNPSKMDSAQRLSFSYFIIAEQHQGQLAVLCDENKNTVFSIRLPKS